MSIDNTDLAVGDRVRVLDIRRTREEKIVGLVGEVSRVDVFMCDVKLDEHTSGQTSRTVITGCMNSWLEVTSAAGVRRYPHCETCGRRTNITCHVCGRCVEKANTP